MADASQPDRKFSRSQRIRQGRDFKRVRNQGQRLVKGCLIANWMPLAAGSPARLGVITSRKVGGAVERSRARRFLREAFRLHRQELEQAVDLVLVARPSIAGKSFRDVEHDYLTALQRARLLNRDR